MVFTLLVSPYRELALTDRTLPAVTIVIAGWNEEDAIGATLERIAALTYPSQVEVVLPDNNSTDRTGQCAEETAARLGLDYRRVFEPEAGKHRALNAVLPTVTTPLVVTVHADTFCILKR
jgi:poly-beta-1,6-N-acetyl-D-glucosamine synthase